MVSTLWDAKEIQLEAGLNGVPVAHYESNTEIKASKPLCLWKGTCPLTSFILLVVGKLVCVRLLCNLQCLV